MDHPQDTDPLPSANEFRVWLRKALEDTKVSVRGLATHVAISRTAIDRFLNTPDREIELGNAEKISAFLVAEAQRQGKSLPAYVVSGHE